MSVPMTDYQHFIDRVKEKFVSDHRIAALLAGGSMMAGEMDEYSDLDLIVVYEPKYRDEIMSQRLDIAGQLGTLLAAFTGEHVGEPRLIICLYGPDPLHVDFKFIEPNELERRIEDPLVLWDRTGKIDAILRKTACSPLQLEPQWIEDRFWVWVHYGAAKLGRGELFECIDMITYLRNVVLGSTITVLNGHLPRGVRKLERLVPDEMAELAATVPVHDVVSCYAAMQSTVRLYRRYREQLQMPVIYKKEAEQAAMLYLERVGALTLRTP